MVKAAAAGGPLPDNAAAWPNSTRPDRVVTEAVTSGLFWVFKRPN